MTATLTSAELVRIDDPQTLERIRIGCDRYAVHDDTHGLTTMLAAAALAGLDPPRSVRTANHAISRVAKVVSDYLGNTPAIARRSYADPRVFDRYRAGWTIHPEVAELGIDLEARPPSARRPSCGVPTPLLSASIHIEMRHLCDLICRFHVSPGVVNGFNID